MTLAEPRLAQAGELNWTDINHTRSRVKARWRHLTKVIHLAVREAGSLWTPLALDGGSSGPDLLLSVKGRGASLFLGTLVAPCTGPVRGLG